MKDITYTFIIPHHNCPELLDRCLTSIPQRDDIQVIVVDDNSLVDRYKAYREKCELQKEKARYEENIKKDKEFLEAIQSDPKALEKFAREEYKMKGDDEDVYIIKED